MQYVRQLTQPVGQIANISNILQSTAAAAERVFEFLAEPEKGPTGRWCVSTPTTGCRTPTLWYTFKGSVQFAHVSFGYIPGKTVIKDFSAIISPGQRAAIVGPTGAGKTTIVKLFDEVLRRDSGAILIDGVQYTGFRPAGTALPFRDSASGYMALQRHNKRQYPLRQA